MKNKTKIEYRLGEKLKNSKNISLSKNEKQRMLTFLTSYADLNPIREQKISESKTTPSPFRFFTLRFTSTLFIALFFLSGGLAMANGALPGETLYAIKTAQENLRNRFSFTPESSARFNSKRVENRLNEVQRLAQTGLLSPEITRDLSAELEDYAISIKENLRELENQDKEILALEIRSEYLSTISVYRDLLSQFPEKNKAAVSLTQDLAIKIDQTEETIAFNIGDGLSNPEEIAFGAELMTPEEESLEISKKKGLLQAESSVSSRGAADEILENKNPAINGFGDDDSEKPPLGSETVTKVIESKENKVLDIDVLELFVAARLDKTELLLDKSKLDEEVKSQLAERLKKARDSYEKGLSSVETEPGVARGHFKQALTVSEYVGAIIRVSKKIPASEISDILGRAIPENIPAIINNPELVLDLGSEEGGEISNEENSEGDEELLPVEQSPNLDSLPIEVDSEDVLPVKDKINPNNKTFN